MTHFADVVTGTPSACATKVGSISVITERVWRGVDFVEVVISVSFHRVVDFVEVVFSVISERVCRSVLRPKVV